MNAVQTETIRQFVTLTPESLRSNGRTFKRTTTLFGAGTEVVFAWASKRKGAFCADKVVATVAYDHASDTYGIKVVRFDGVTFATETLADLDGATFEAFENVAAIAA